MNKLAVLNKTIKLILNIFLIIMIGLLVIYVLLRFTNNIEILKVQTGSMEDGIHTGDYIMIAKKNDYKVGDIVTYKSEDFYITHRVIKENGDKVITKGDANNQEDAEIKKSSIVGKVIYIGGLLNIIIKFKYVFVIIFLLLYFATYFIDKSKKEN